MMSPLRALILAPALLITSCSSTSTTGTSKQMDDASARTEDTDSSTTDGRGATGSDESSGGSVTDASVASVPLSCPRSPSVTDLLQTSLPQSPVRPGAGGTTAIDGGDGGRLPGLPTDPCVTYASPACPGGPRSIFGCPTARGPNGSTTIHPGDQVTVTVPMSDAGLAAYSCFGIDANDALIGGYYLTYAVQPAYAEATGQVPPSSKPGAVIHFTAEASGSRYTSAPGTACSNDLTSIQFDVTVSR